MSRFLSSRPALAAVAAAAACACGSAAAQAGTSGNAAGATVLITGNPLGSDTVAQPASVLAGTGLVLRRAATLGETLDGLPGVSASGFGPNSSRPVIRGLDGDRLRLLDNGGAAVDASSLSFDHAVAADPLVAERIEVLRGPAALLYGGNATGGVVNSIDNRIPRAPAGGLSGRAELRLGGAAAARSGAAVLEGGAGAWAWHADAYGHQGSDLRVPSYTPVREGEALDAARRVRNSAARGHGGAIGAGWVSEHGYLGAAVDTMRKRYGVTVEPDVFIRMQRDRLALAGEWRRLAGPITQVSAQASHTRYRHEEVEGSGEVGTIFTSRGQELRLQLQHAPLGPLRGVFGVQNEALDFSALGAEAFVPGTRTRSNALFVLEELGAGPVVFSAGARLERVRVASDGDAPAAEEPRFGGATERRFSPASVSLGARVDAGSGITLSTAFGRTQRAPAYYELYANGVHVATAAYERGDVNLGLERSRHLEGGAGWSQGPHSVKLNVFSTRFASFISLDASGATIDIPGEGGEPGAAVPEYNFRAVRARLRGLEIEGRTRLLERPFTLEASAGLDAVCGDNLDAGEPLPRLPPQRWRAGLEAGTAGWRAGLVWRHAARQIRVPATDSATPGYTLLDLWATGPLVPGATWFARLANATDRLAYNAAATATMRGLAPLPGRAFTAGVQLRL